MLRAAIGAGALVASASCSPPPAHDGATGSDGVTADAGEAVERATDCEPRGGDAAAVNSASDVAYARRGGETLRFDIAWPRGGGRHPLVVLLHGGGWEGGSRDALHDEMLALARRGYAAATVSYRLTRAPRNIFPAAVADVRCAVRFLRANAATYDIAPERVAAAGFSAGAYLSAMLGAAADEGALEDGAPPCEAGRSGDASVQAVISYAGPQDLRVNGPYTQEQARLVTNFLGVFAGDDPERAAIASPIVHAGRGDPPFLLVHGTKDDLVPVEHSRRMAAALRRAGTAATVLELPRTGHSFVGLLTSGDATVRCTTERFLARWLVPD